MSQDIKLRRSAVEGKVPTTAQLNLGELAINTYDGKIFFKKDVNSVESIVTVEQVTENNLSIDTSSYSNSSATNLAGVLSDLDDAIEAAAAGGLLVVSSDSTLSGNGTSGSPLSVVDNGHNHTISNIANLQASLDSLQEEALAFAIALG